MKKHQNQRVLVVEYNPEWKNHFNQIKNYIWPTLSANAISIEHVGSTSVYGLAAKPVIDIDIIVEDQIHLEIVIKKLEKLGFEHRGNLGIEGREAFSQLPQFSKHNLYVCLNGCLALENHLNFRNYLSQNPKAVKEYSQLKFDLARKTNDIELYVEGKTEFITRILAKTGITPQALKEIEDVNKSSAKDDLSDNSL